MITESASTGSSVSQPSGSGGNAAPPSAAPAPAANVGGQANVSPQGDPNDPGKKVEPKPSGFDSLGKKAAAPKPGDNPAAAAYQPNFKFKVLDKEHEMDEWLKGTIKDPETEKKARELYEKAFGLDSVKQDRQTLKGENGELKDRIQKTDQALEMIGGYARANDWDSFFEALKIPTERIVQYAIKVAQREQDPVVKAQWEANRTATTATRQYNDANQQLAHERQQFAVQQRVFELDQVVSRPETVAVAQAYDAGMGTPGAFKEYVIRIGQAYAAQGKDIPAEQAVAEAIRHLKAVNPTLGMAPQTPPSLKVVAPNTAPVIPNMGGRGTSPVKSTIRTFDDLKNKAKELNGSSGY